MSLQRQLFKDHIKADLNETIFAYDYRKRLACAMPLDFQGPPTRNIISQIVQKCTFPVYSNKTLRFELFAHQLLYIFQFTCLNIEHFM